VRPKPIILIPTFLLIAGLAVWFLIIKRKPDAPAKAPITQRISTNPKPEDNSEKVKDMQPDNAAKAENKGKDTNVVIYFKDLSNVYNYKIIDKGFNHHRSFFDSVYRVIKIYNKADSLTQRIIPTFEEAPAYLFERYPEAKPARSYMTNKNTKNGGHDDYFGELVVADLNFDGLEDFATYRGHGADNGAHYAYYFQNKKHRFEYNSYLTENMIWFPAKINDSLKTLTTIVPAGMFGVEYTTFKYNPASQKWKVIKDYTIDVKTGKILE
jgi:hypothetical protein